MPELIEKEKCLKGKRVLIVDEDFQIASGTAELLQEQGAEVEIRHCMTGSKEGGLDALLQADSPYDLVIVEIIAIPNEKALEVIEDHRKEIRLRHNIIRKIRKKYNDEHGVKEELYSERDRNNVEELRSKINYLKHLIWENCDRCGGVQMIKQWQIEMDARHAHKWKRTTAILYFTTLEESEIEEEVLKEENTAYLEKIAWGDEVIEAVAKLLNIPVERGIQG